jgi:C4-dicarboxylate-specific signal transduction histidine kinase
MGSDGAFAVPLRLWVVGNAITRRGIVLVQGRRVRASFRKDSQIRSSIGLNGLVDETIELLRSDLERHRIEVSAEPDAKLPQVTGNRIQLQQVLVNLIKNAIDSMAAEGQPRLLSVRSELRRDGGVMLSVSDTGPGVKAQDADLIFNPLFTTKPSGMGMGLSICRSIIETHSGSLLLACYRQSQGRDVPDCAGSRGGRWNLTAGK